MIAKSYIESYYVLDISFSLYFEVSSIFLSVKKNDQKTNSKMGHKPIFHEIYFSYLTVNSKINGRMNSNIPFLPSIESLFDKLYII